MIEPLPTYAMAAAAGDPPASSGDVPEPIAEGTASGNPPVATKPTDPVPSRIDDAASAPVAEVVETDAAAEQSLVAWEPDLRIAEDAGGPDATTESPPSDADDDRPSQSRFFADAEARRLSRIKR